MLRELLLLVPKEWAQRPPTFLFSVAGAGLLLALMGGRFSRSLVTLSAVSVGAIVGLHLPAWAGWHVDAIGAAFCGAIVLGLTGFLLHRTWIGFFLSSLLSAYAVTFTWILRAGEAKWTMPTLDLSQGIPVALNTLWKSLPAGLYPALPIAYLAAAGIGTLLSVLWPRLGRVLFYSLLGDGVAVIAGALAVQQLWPWQLERTPKNPQFEILMFSGVVVITSGLQWLLLPRVARQLSTQSENLHDDDADTDDAAEEIIEPFGKRDFPIAKKRQQTASRRQRLE